VGARSGESARGVSGPSEDEAVLTEANDGVRLDRTEYEVVVWVDAKDSRRGDGSIVGWELQAPSSSW